MKKSISNLRNSKTKSMNLKNLPKKLIKGLISCYILIDLLKNYDLIKFDLLNEWFRVFWLQSKMKQRREAVRECVYVCVCARACACIIDLFKERKWAKTKFSKNFDP